MLFKSTDSVNANVIKFLLKAVKLIIWFGAVAYIVYKLIGFTGEQYNNWFIFSRPDNSVFFILLLVCLLSILNWTLESLKWQSLSGKIQDISFMRSFKGVLLGVAMGMVTPKRLGEFAGRVIVLEKNKRIEGAVINVAGTICQLMVTLIAGGVSIFILFFHQNVHFSAFFSFNAGAVLLIIFAVLSIIAYFFRKRLISFFEKYKWFCEGYKKLLVLKKINGREFLRLFLLSFLRYVVFMSQCYLLYSLAGLKLTIPEVLIFQSIVFLFMTIMPVSAFSELAVKGGVAIVVFTQIFAGSVVVYHGYELSIVIANGLLWFVNLAIPALVGVIWGMDYGFSFRKQFV